jgi:hypothetical protein
MIAERVVHVSRPTPTLPEGDGAFFAVASASSSPLLNSTAAGVASGRSGTLYNGPFVSPETNILLSKWLRAISNNADQDGTPQISQNEALCALRNKVLGHGALRRHLVLHANLVERLLPILVASSSARDALDQCLCKEVVTILGSIAYGGTEEVAALVRNNIPQVLLDLVAQWAICTDGTIDRESLKFPATVAAVRALRTLYRHPGTPRDLPFSQKYLGTILALLDHFKDGAPHRHYTQAAANLLSQVREYAAVMLANCCDSLEKQKTLIQSGTVEIALSIASAPDFSSSAVEAALDLLAALSRENKLACSLIASKQSSVDLLFAMATGKTIAATSKDFTPSAFGSTCLLSNSNPKFEVQIFASVCLANMARNVPRVSADKRIEESLLPSLATLLSSPLRAVRIRAAQVLALLLADSDSLQTAAVTLDSAPIVPRLISMLKEEPIKSFNGDGSSHSQPYIGPLVLQLRLQYEAALMALAAVSSFREECRKVIIDSGALPLIVSSMSSEDESVRAAACQATRSLSRSVKNLRTSLLDAGVAEPLLKLLSDPYPVVQTAAAAALCNLVLDFSPLKETVLRQGGVARLVEIVSRESSTRARSMRRDSPDGGQIDDGDMIDDDAVKADGMITEHEHEYPADLRFNALWALKNLLYLAETPVKTAVMDLIGCSRIEALASDSEPLPIQEQAMNLLRNLVCEREQDISVVVDRFGAERLVDLIGSKLRSPSPDVVVHACYVIANACTAASSGPKAVVMSRVDVLSRIAELLSLNEPVAIQLAALWCVINLTWAADAGSEERVRTLRSLGIETRLRSLFESEPTGDMRDRLQTALNNFSAVIERETGLGEMRLIPSSHDQRRM